MLYQVIYEFTDYGNDGQDIREFMGIFESYETGLAYLRKFYEGDKTDALEYTSVKLSQTEYKDGVRYATASRRYHDEPIFFEQALHLQPALINDLKDPFADIKDVHN